MNTKDYTQALLAESQLFRDNDTELLIRVLRDQGIIEDEEHAQRFRIMQFDLWDVRRARQKIQEEGLYPASPHILEKRQKREIKEHDKYSKRIIHPVKEQQKLIKEKFDYTKYNWVDQDGRSLTI